jgi:hypothetical protein
MHRFALKNIEQVKGKISFFKLEIDGKCYFDDFCKSFVSPEEEKVLAVIYATMDSVANLKFLPNTKFRELKGRRKSDKIKDFEIKKDDIRVYLFKDKAGHIVVFAGCKNDQEEDIARLRRIKLEYINSL